MSDYNIIDVVRVLHRSSGAVIGRLFINDVAFCDTLENELYLCPEGTYNLALNIKSPKYSTNAYYKGICEGCLPRLLNVPHRDGILIHCGNFARDSRGCILVGNYVPTKTHFFNYISSSKATFTSLMKRLRSFKYPCKIRISDVSK